MTDNREGTNVSGTRLLAGQVLLDVPCGELLERSDNSCRLTEGVLGVLCPGEEFPGVLMAVAQRSQEMSPKFSSPPARSSEDGIQRTGNLEIKTCKE